MKTYVSKLVIQASQITSVVRDGETVLLHLKDDEAVFTETGPAWASAAAGGYLVVYGDGLHSYVPGSAFEARFKEKVDHIAEVAFEVLRARDADNGDLSVPRWEDADQLAKGIMRNTVDWMLDKTDRPSDLNGDEAFVWGVVKALA